MTDTETNEDDLMEISEEEFLATTPRTFHPFWRLPVEMQMKIWGFALPEPRIAHLRMIAIPESIIKRVFAPRSSRRNTQRRCITTDCTTVSPLLSTCKLSRQIVLETCKLHIASRGPLRFYVDDMTDWVILGDREIQNVVRAWVWTVDMVRVWERALCRAKRLVFPGKIFFLGVSWEDMDKWLLSIFASLEALIICSKSVSAPEEIWKNDNLRLLTDTELWDTHGVGGSEIALDDQAEKEEHLEALRVLLMERFGRCPEVTHMWLYSKDEVVEKVDENVRVRYQGRRIRRDELYG